MLLENFAGSGHRMFLLTRKTLAQPDNEAGAAEEFEVLGATGNGEMYTICCFLC